MPSRSSWPQGQAWPRQSGQDCPQPRRSPRSSRPFKQPPQKPREQKSVKGPCSPSQDSHIVLLIAVLHRLCICCDCLAMRCFGEVHAAPHMLLIDQSKDDAYSNLRACHHAGCMSDNSSLLCLQEAAASFAAVLPEGAMEAMYIALKQAISAHSPVTVPPVSKPLVLAGPFGAACHKGELLQWLLQEYGSSIALPEMVTTKPRQDGAVASSAFKVWSDCLRRKTPVSKVHAPYCLQKCKNRQMQCMSVYVYVQ